MRVGEAEITIESRPSLSNQELNELFAAAWPSHSARDFLPVLARSLVYMAAFARRRLVGFVNVAWDGGKHGFLLDTTVAPEVQRRGVGTALAAAAVAAARGRGLEWLHVDFEPELAPFYRKAGFAHTEAGLLRL
jgi:GNAT superfamily N-acetyltransferase